MAAATPFASSLKPSSSSSCIQQGGRGGSCRDAVYVASVPLRATRGPPQLLMSAAYSLGLWDLQHFMVIIKPTTTQSNKVIVYDFQPQDPENIFVALAALSKNQVPGVLRKRTLSRLPKTRCWFVGFSLVDGVEMADKFNKNWSTDLIIGKHDCRHYTGGLVQNLTGEQSVLDLLRETSRQGFIL